MFNIVRSMVLESPCVNFKVTDTAWDPERAFTLE